MSRFADGPGRGVLLVAHGTRNPGGLDEAHRLARQVAQLLPRHPVELVFLELADPDVPCGVEKLLAQGAAEVVLVPLLLFAAGHWKRDLPQLVDELRRRHPGVPFHLASVLDCDEEVVALAAARFLEARERLERETPSELLAGPLVPLEEPLAARSSGAATALVLVGRGTSDAEAQQRLHCLGRLVARRAGAVELRTCFVERGRPLLSEVLEQLELFATDRVVVQPHLLFAGRVLQQVQQAVEEARSRFPRHRLVMARPLGAALPVARALARRVALA